VRNNDAAIYRFEPRTGSSKPTSPTASPTRTAASSTTGATTRHRRDRQQHLLRPRVQRPLDYPQKHADLTQFWDARAPSPGTGIAHQPHFPQEFQGNLLNLNVISFQGIYRVKVVEDGGGLHGEQQADLVSSDDPNFRPTAVNVGPDGAIYFADWHNPIIGHMQHHIRDPNRDHSHGRIYRMTYNGRPLAVSRAIDGAPIPALLDLLKEPENQVREWTKIELGKRDHERSPRRGENMD
jgi:hypothetical protein